MKRKFNWEKTKQGYVIVCLIIFILLLVSPLIFSMTCQTIKRDCVAPKSTRIIQGIPVTLDCWRYRLEKKCVSDVSNTCAGVRKQSCTQLNAACLENINGVCLSQQVRFTCSIQSCPVTPSHQNQSPIFCEDGNCATPESIPSHDFDEAVSHLAALAATAKEVKTNEKISKEAIAFKGKAMECSNNLIHFKNCCAMDGWGRDLELVHCTDEERALAQKRKKEVTIQVSTDRGYCHNRVDLEMGSVCTSRHRVFCVFESKLAQLIQQEGREKQLGISFGIVEGDTNRVDCRGISVQELQKINFKKIDFTPLYKDLKDKANIPDNNKLDTIINKRVQDFYARGISHEK